MADLNNPSTHPATTNPLPQPSLNDHPVSPRAAAAAKPKTRPAPAQSTDSFREVIDTIVFVVVLVLLLKSFIAEAFVIPTGSMATTLLGYHKNVTCPECGFEFPVNCSEEVEGKPPRPTVGAICPNCRFRIDLAQVQPVPKWNSGDRVLVAKYLYDTGVLNPQRLDVVVFKYPVEPQKDHIPLNYIKRLIGLSGETIGIYYGKLYVLPAGQGPQYPEDNAANPLDRWRHDHNNHHNDFMHQGEADALLKQDNSAFRILRKPAIKKLALRRIVYDNDHPAADLTATPRWVSETDNTWLPDGAHGFRNAGQGGEDFQWLCYQHLLRDQSKPELITDFVGYNSRAQGERWDGKMTYPSQGGNWVGDLMLECEVQVDQPAGDLVLELSKGVDRFRATWELASGTCILTRLHDGKEEELGRKPTNLSKPGTYHLRFANVDEQLTVWVDRSLPFGDGVEYPAPPERTPTANDLKPARIGIRGGAVHIRKLTLWRDSYYTVSPDPRQPDSPKINQDNMHDLLSDPNQFKDTFGSLRPQTYYVQPGHYLCLGDNSPESSDGRSWGLVPQRLLLGRALMVYFPFWPFGANRVGTIE